MLILPTGGALAEFIFRSIGIVSQHVVPAMATVVNEVRHHLKTAGFADEVREDLGRICMIALAFIEQAYVEVSSQAVLRETG